MTIERGWYPDPASPHQLRWWTGQLWTEETRPRPPEPEVPAAAGGRPARADDVWLPVQMVEYGYLPPVCVRHGRPAIRMQRAPSYSRTPIWVVPLILVGPGILLALLIALIMRVTVWGAWPVCELCETRRRQYLHAMAVVLAASALSIVAAIGLHAAGWLLLDVLLVPAAIVLGSLSGWTRVTSGIVDSKRGVVTVKKPSASFVAALNRQAAPPQALVPPRW